MEDVVKFVGKGKWNIVEVVKYIRNVKWIVENVRNFVDFYYNKFIDGKRFLYLIFIFNFLNMGYIIIILLLSLEKFVILNLIFIIIVYFKYIGYDIYWL